MCALTIFLTDMYVKDIQTGICAKDGEPVVEKESAATALVDGRNLLGPVVGNFCMKLAIKKAKEVGIGWVVAHGESHMNPKVIAVTQLNMFLECLPLNWMTKKLFFQAGFKFDKCNNITLLLLLNIYIEDLLFQAPTIMVLLGIMRCKHWRKTWLWVKHFVCLFMFFSFSSFFLTSKKKKALIECTDVIFFFY